MKHAKTCLADVPDEVLVAECARRNLRVHGDVVSSAINTPHLMKGQGADAIEKLLAVRYTTLGELGVGSSSVVYEISPVKDPTKRYALKVMQKGATAGGHSREVERCGQGDGARIEGRSMMIAGGASAPVPVCAGDLSCVVPALRSR